MKEDLEELEELLVFYKRAHVHFKSDGTAELIHPSKLTTLDHATYFKNEPKSIGGSLRLQSTLKRIYNKLEVTDPEQT